MEVTRICQNQLLFNTLPYFRNETVLHLSLSRDPWCLITLMKRYWVFRTVLLPFWKTLCMNILHLPWKIERIWITYAQIIWLDASAFFYEVSSVHNTTHSKYLIMPIHQAILAKLKRRGEKEEYEKNFEKKIFQQNVTWSYLGSSRQYSAENKTFL